MPDEPPQYQDELDPIQKKLLGALESIEPKKPTQEQIKRRIESMRLNTIAKTALELYVHKFDDIDLSIDKAVEFEDRLRKKLGIDKFNEESSK